MDNNLRYSLLMLCIAAVGHSQQYIEPYAGKFITAILGAIILTIITESVIKQNRNAANAANVDNVHNEVKALSLSLELVATMSM